MTMYEACLGSKNTSRVGR